MNKLLLAEEQMDKIVIMGKFFYPLKIIRRANLPETILTYNRIPARSNLTRHHWLEFCIVNIIPNIKICGGTEYKAFMQNLLANFHEGARCVHPVDYLYELYKKDC